MKGDIWLSPSQLTFIKVRFREKDSDKAIDKCIEFLIKKGLDPFKLDVHIREMMTKENN